MRSDYQIGEFIFLFILIHNLYIFENQIILQSRFVQLLNHLTDVNLWGDDRGKAKKRETFIRN